MKATLLASIVLLLALGPLPAAAQEASGRTGFTYQAWTSDEDEDGSQCYVPLHLDARSGRFSMHLTAGYAHTSGDMDGTGSRSAVGFLDTQFGGALTFAGWAGWDWMAGVDLNLPTGRTGLDERELRVMVDPDLVEIVSPGQGHNINPYIGLARQWDRWLFGLGAGYAFQGKYDYSDQTRDYDPGDIFTVAAQVSHAVSGPWRLTLQGQYATTGEDKAAGNPLMQKGDTWLVKAGLERADDRWEMAFSVQTILKGKAQVRDAGGVLRTEARNSQGQEWTADLLGGYRLSPRTGLNAGLQYLYLHPNDYDTTSPLYMGRRQKYTLSLGLTQTVTEGLELGVGLKGFFMDDEPNWLHPNEDRQYRGWSAAVALTQRF